MTVVNQSVISLLPILSLYWKIYYYYTTTMCLDELTATPSISAGKRDCWSVFTHCIQAVV